MLSRYISFCFDFLVMCKNNLIRKIRFWCHNLVNKQLQYIYSQSHSCAQMGNSHCFCFIFKIKPLKGCRLWASRPIFWNQCPKSLILGVTQVAVFSIGPKSKVAKSKNNWCQMIDHSKRRKIPKDHVKTSRPGYIFNKNTWNFQGVEYYDIWVRPDFS